MISSNSNFNNTDYNSNEEQSMITPLLALPDYSLFSELGQRLVIEVRELNKHRKIFCSIEYPLSFTGQEAVVSYILLLRVNKCMDE